MMKLKERIKAAWKVLTMKYAIVHASNADVNYLLIDAILLDVAELLHRGIMTTERYQMIDSVLSDRSVILQSMHRQKDGKTVPTVIYDCESEEDFNELREQEIE